MLCYNIITHNINIKTDIKIESTHIAHMIRQLPSHLTVSGILQSKAMNIGRCEDKRGKWWWVGGLGDK